MDIPENNGEIDIKTAYVRGLESFAVKIASGFYGNEKGGLPRVQRNDGDRKCRNRLPEGRLFDNGYLTQLRTGAVGTIPAKYLAPEGIETACVIGARTQVWYQAAAFRQVRGFRRLLVCDTDLGRLGPYAAETAGSLAAEVVESPSAEEVVRQSDVAVTTMTSRQPYLRAEWLYPHLQITAMRSDAEGKQEVFADVSGKVDLIVCDLKSQCYARGELHHALDLKSSSWAN